MPINSSPRRRNPDQEHATINYIKELEERVAELEALETVPEGWTLEAIAQVYRWRIEAPSSDPDYADAWVLHECHDPERCRWREHSQHKTLDEAIAAAGKAPEEASDEQC